MISAGRGLSTDSPRSRRVGIASPPPGFNLQNPHNVTQHDSPLHSPGSPPLPLRSPLRPASRSISSGSSTASTIVANSDIAPAIRPHRPATPPPLDIDDIASIVEIAVSLPFNMRHREYLTLNAIDVDAHIEDMKALPLRPESPFLLSPVDEPASSSSSLVQQQPLSRRQHALHELLSSERAYASDLAIIRGVHIPLALGQQPHSISISPTSSFSSSPRTLSISSESSISSTGPPMTPEDVRIIFSNIEELARFSDEFGELLEEALGSLIDGGVGEDRVGSLFLELIPEMERPYKHYITRHPAALSHLQSIPQTPAFTAYLSQTKTAVSSLTHAWDLPSLLIKPVQRLLKYPLLLAAIMDETPDAHTDKENLRIARLKMEEVARNVNEGRRRAEVVKEVLSSKKKPAAVNVAVNVTRMKSLRHVVVPGKSPSSGMQDANGEAAQVERMQVELKRAEQFAQQFAKDIVEWAKTMSGVVRTLRMWAASFGKVIGLSPEQGSEAFDAFMAVVEQQLMPLCCRLEEDISGRLMKELAHLLATMDQPRKLLASMNEQEPLHYHLLNMNVSAKNRPAPSLLAASTNYLALRGQLAAELPSYLTLLHRGLGLFVRKLAAVQAEFWRDVRDRWADLWEMLRVEGEMNAGHQETLSVWQARWADVDEIMSSLNINQMKKLYGEHAGKTGTHAGTQQPGYIVVEAATPPGKKSQTVANTIASFDPSYVMGPFSVSSPFPLTPSRKARARGSSDASGSGLAYAQTYAQSKKTLAKKPSHDDAIAQPPPHGKSEKTKLQKKRGEEPFEFVVSPGSAGMAMPPTGVHSRPGTIPRTKSMPLPAERSVSYRSSASSKTLVGSEGDSATRRHSQELQQQHQQQQQNEEGRGRASKKATLRRKFTDKQQSSSRQRSGSRSTQTSFFDEALLDSPTLPSPPPPPPLPSYTRNSHRDTWVTRQAKYMCQVVHPCHPPAAVSYFSFPFFTLAEGDIYQVLQEAGHPSIHPKLPLYVDDGEDCLLLCRDEEGNVGWALASFLAPVSN